MRNHENLWVMSSNNYKNLEREKQAWDDIALSIRAMGIVTTKEQCHKKWRYLRDTYQRVKKKNVGRSGDAGGRAAQWKFFKNLLFLDNAIVTRKTISSTIDGSQEMDDDSENVDDEGPSVCIPSKDNEENIPVGLHEAEMKSKKNTKKEVTKIENELMSCLELWKDGRRCPSEDEFDAYGKYIARSLKKMDSNASVHEKMEIQQVSIYLRILEIILHICKINMNRELRYHYHEEYF